jgi:hypothetical protein
MRIDFRLVITIALAGATLFGAADPARAGWQIEYSDRMVGAIRQWGYSQSKRVGYYATRAACEDALRRGVTQSGDPTLARHAKCVGFDDVVAKPKPAPAPAKPIQGSGTTQGTDKEQERLIQEQERQKALEREKAALLAGLRGVSPGNPGTLVLKPVPDPKPPASSPVKPIDPEQINRRIAELQREISGIQTLLRGYSRTLHGTRSEFEKWEQTVDESYNEVFDSSKEYLAQMFLSYNMLGALERSVQKTVYMKVAAFLGSDDPAVKKWLVQQVRGDTTQLARLKKVVDVGVLSGDFASLLTGGQEETKRNLDALLFVNSLMETGDIVNYEKMLEKSNLFKELPGGYFTQARMIGETYANLSAIAHGWYSIRKLTDDVSRYDREIQSLSFRMKQAMKETECLKRCLQDPADRCMDRCAGKTRLSTPPPLPR